jgi:hypothetical protein
MDGKKMEIDVLCCKCGDVETFPSEGELSEHISGMENKYKELGIVGHYKLICGTCLEEFSDYAKDERWNAVAKAAKEKLSQDSRPQELGWDAYKKAIKERWEKIGNTAYKCSKHNNIFPQLEEPCWACWNEFGGYVDKNDLIPAIKRHDTLVAASTAPKSELEKFKPEELEKVNNILKETVKNPSTKKAINRKKLALWSAEEKHKEYIYFREGECVSKTEWYELAKNPDAIKEMTKNPHSETCDCHLCKPDLWEYEGNNEWKNREEDIWELGEPSKSKGEAYFVPNQAFIDAMKANKNKPCPIVSQEEAEKIRNMTGPIYGEEVFVPFPQQNSQSQVSQPQACECGAHKVKDSSHALWCPCSAKETKSTKYIIGVDSAKSKDKSSFADKIKGLSRVYIKDGRVFIGDPRALEGKLAEDEKQRIQKAWNAKSLNPNILDKTFGKIPCSFKELNEIKDEK